MSTPDEIIAQICQSIARQVRDHDRTIHLNFLAHRNGQRLEALSTASQELLSHPAGEAAIRLFKTPQEGEGSAFLGLGVWRESMLGGLASRNNILALITLNMDDMPTAHMVAINAWHLTWQALRMTGLRDDPDYESDFRGGILLPDPEAQTDPALCLRADIFSALMERFNGDRNAARQLAQDRSMAVLQRASGQRPETYPFPLTLETTLSVCDEIMRRPPARRNQIDTALQAADTIGATYDDAIVPQWTAFCTPAQDMAWRGESPDRILSAAVNTSPDTFVRATGFLVAETTGITPASIHTIQDMHNPFADEKYGHRLHERLVSKTIDDAIQASMESHNSKIFREAATRQNEGLIDGHIAGWCAAALQAAGRAFDAALASGSKAPAEAARREFDSTRYKTTWESLRALGETIIAQYRNGQVVTFGDILDFCGDQPSLASLSHAVQSTVKDPAYVRKLNAANDLTAIPPGLETPPPSPQPAYSPTLSPGPRPPGLGSHDGRPPRPEPSSHDDDTTTVP